MQMTVDNLRIRLASVEEAVINTPLPEIKGELFPDDLGVSYQISVDVDRPRSLVAVDVTLTYMDDRLTLFSGSLKTSFSVVDLASYITMQEGDGEFRIESDFFPLLVETAFSTARGYFARELQDTPLAPYPFPMIAQENLLKRTTYQLR